MSCGYIAVQTTETAAGGETRTVSLFPVHWISPCMIAAIAEPSVKNSNYRKSRFDVYHLLTATLYLYNNYLYLRVQIVVYCSFLFLMQRYLNWWNNKLDPEMKCIPHTAALKRSLWSFECVARYISCIYPVNRCLLVDLALAHPSQSTNVFTKHTAHFLPTPQCNEATARARPPSALLSPHPVPPVLQSSGSGQLKVKVKTCTNELTVQL